MPRVQNTCKGNREVAERDVEIVKGGSFLLILATRNAFVLARRSTKEILLELGIKVPCQFVMLVVSWELSMQFSVPFYPLPFLTQFYYGSVCPSTILEGQQTNEGCLQLFSRFYSFALASFLRVTRVLIG